jgi:hypothetical protein
LVLAPLRLGMPSLFPIVTLCRPFLLEIAAARAAALSEREVKADKSAQVRFCCAVFVTVA